MGLNPVILLAVLAVLAGGGALGLLKLVKNKPKTKGNDNLDDYDYGEDDTRPGGRGPLGDRGIPTSRTKNKQ